MPVVRVSTAVMAPISRISPGSRVAPSPMLWGNRVAPTMLLWPCTASMPQMIGMAWPPPDVSIEASQNASARSSHACGLALYWLPGSEPPPARIDPSRYLRTSSGVIEAMSPWMTWPTFSSTDIVAISASIRCSSVASGGRGQPGCGQCAGSIVVAVSMPRSGAPAQAVRSAPASKLQHRRGKEGVRSFMAWTPGCWARRISHRVAK